MIEEERERARQGALMGKDTKKDKGRDVEFILPIGCDRLQSSSK